MYHDVLKIPNRLLTLIIILITNRVGREACLAHDRVGIVPIGTYRTDRVVVLAVLLFAVVASATTSALLPVELDHVHEIHQPLLGFLVVAVEDAQVAQIFVGSGHVLGGAVLAEQLARKVAQLAEQPVVVRGELLQLQIGPVAEVAVIEHGPNAGRHVPGEERPALVDFAVRRTVDRGEAVVALARLVGVARGELEHHRAGDGFGEGADLGGRGR